jgi:hypothetical protein
MGDVETAARDEDGYLYLVVKPETKELYDYRHWALPLY